MSQKLFTDLIRGYYILYFNGALVITNKLLREFDKPLEPIKESEPEPVKVVQTTLPSVQNSLPSITTVVPGVSPFMKFIKDCQVPEKIPTRTGSYWANRYSKPAEKEFLKILNSGYQYDILVTATRLYYKAGGMPKAISNYIIDGIWQGCYQDMLTSLENGTINQHIKKNMDTSTEDGNSRYER